jgi:hypothetical protein
MITVIIMVRPNNWVSAGFETMPSLGFRMAKFLAIQDWASPALFVCIEVRLPVVKMTVTCSPA